MNRASGRWLLTAFLVTAPMLGADIAHADGESATELIDRGIDLREAQRDSEALVLFEKAQALSPTPRGQAQVALAQQALGRWALAEKNLAGALADKDDAWITSHRAVLEHALGVIRAHLGDVQIVGASAGVVYVDGVRFDDADARTHLRLEVGRRTLEIRAPGMYPFSRIIDVRVGETARVEVLQHPLIDDPVAHPVGSASVDAGRTQRTLGWLFLGGAGLFLATGAGGQIARAVTIGDFNSTPSCTNSVVGSVSFPAKCQGWLSDGTTEQTVSIVGFVGGGLLGAISLAMLLTAPSSKTKAPIVAMPYGCSPIRAGLLCGATGTF